MVYGNIHTQVNIFSVMVLLCSDKHVGFIYEGLSFLLIFIC